jgi:hypothetical protein
MLMSNPQIFITVLQSNVPLFFDCLSLDEFFFLILVARLLVGSGRIVIVGCHRIHFSMPHSMMFISPSKIMASQPAATATAIVDVG